MSETAGRRDRQVHMNYEDNDKLIYGMDMDPEEVCEDTPPESGRKPRKKPRVKKKRRKKYYTLRFLAAVLVIVAVYLIMHSSAFTVKNVELEKNDRFSVQLVKDITGLKNGDNLYEVDLKECEKALEKRPYMKSAEVKRKLPDTITIDVEVRVPVAVVKQNGEFVMLDREGYVLEKRKKLPHYTFLDGITVSEAKVGQVVKVKQEKLYQEYMSLIDEMNDADLYFRKMAVKDNNVRLYARYNLYCTGEKKDIVEGMRDGNLKAVLYNLSKKDIKKGVVSVGNDKYYSFSKTAK